MWSSERKSMIGGVTFYVRMRTTNIMLGTQPGNNTIFEQYIARNSPDPDAIPEELESNREGAEGIENEKIAPTIFPVGKFFIREDGSYMDPLFEKIGSAKGSYKKLPFIYDYQIRGGWKESIAMLTKASGGRGSKVKTYASAAISSYKKAVDGNWLVTNRRIPLYIPESFLDDMGNERSTYDEDGNLPIIIRPLRADTAQGPRIALAASQYVPIGTEFYFGIRLLNDADLRACLESLDYKSVVGFLQWRGSGKGTAEWTLCRSDGRILDEIPQSEWTYEETTMHDRIEEILNSASTPLEAPAPKRRGRKKKSETVENPEE